MDGSTAVLKEAQLWRQALRVAIRHSTAPRDQSDASSTELCEKPCREQPQPPCSTSYCRRKVRVKSRNQSQTHAVPGKARRQGETCAKHPGNVRLKNIAVVSPRPHPQLWFKIISFVQRRVACLEKHFRPNMIVTVRRGRGEWENVHALKPKSWCLHTRAPSKTEECGSARAGDVTISWRRQALFLCLER